MSTRCAVCANSDLRRLVELGWNAKMSVADIAHAFGQVPSHATIYKHLREHAGPEAYSRRIEVEDARPVRERVMNIQRAQIEEIERRLAQANQTADDWNEAHRDHEQGGDCRYCADTGFRPVDPSAFFDILSKDMQAAVASILKAQGLTDKREAAKAGIQVDVYRLMLGENGGLAPARLTAGLVEGEAREVPSGDA